jgi:PAS domain S-box-containing protein
MTPGSAPLPDWLSVEHLAASPLVFFRGRPGVVTAVSPNVERVLGYPVGEVVGQPNFWHAHLHPEEAPRLVDEARAATWQRRPSTDLIYRFRHRDGSYRWVNWITHRQYDGAGAVTDLFGYLLDITDRQDSALARERLMLSQGQLEGVIATARHVAHSVNNAFAVATGALELVQAGGADAALVQPALQSLTEAAREVALLHRVVRLALTETPVGPALDLAASMVPDDKAADR